MFLINWIFGKALSFLNS